VIPAESPKLSSPRLEPDRKPCVLATSDLEAIESRRLNPKACRTNDGERVVAGDAVVVIGLDLKSEVDPAVAPGLRELDTLLSAADPPKLTQAVGHWLATPVAPLRPSRSLPEPPFFGGWAHAHPALGTREYFRER
jgi:hypothetical protein